MGAAPHNVEILVGRIMRRNIERAMSAGLVLFGLLLVLADAVFTQFPAYQLVAQFLPQRAYGLALFGLGIVRTVVLIVNGFWPVGPQVRFALSVATLLVAWLPFTLSFSWFALNFLLHEGPGAISPGAISPGVILAPIVAWAEAMCAVALRAWIESSRESQGCSST